MKPIYIDLSHRINQDTVTYKGLPAPIICDYLSREEARQYYTNGETFQIGKIEMVSNTGTYIDCPFHRFENGKDLSEIDIEAFVNLPALVIHAPFTQTLAIDIPFFEGKNLYGKAVLIHTGWAQFWGTENYFDDHPYLTHEAAVFLQEQGVVLVGIDSHNIDNTTTRSRPVHSHLLGNDILIVEHLCQLDMLPDNEFRFSAVPPKFEGVGTFPVRAFATLTK